jgi:uncharacterized phage infection (PIP) family protein YhgE
MPVMTENNQMTQNDDKTQDNSLNQVNSSLANPSSNVQDTLDAIEKARKQEKDKLYQKMKELEDKNKQFEDFLNKEKQKAEEYASQLQRQKEQQMSEEEKIKQTVDKLVQQNDYLSKQLEEVAKNAQERLRESELRAYKAQALARNNVLIPELVSGNSVDEIDNAIKLAKEKEQLLLKQAEERVRAEVVSTLPKPSQSATIPDSPSNMIDPRKKYEIANLSPSDFAKYKADALQRARTGFTR